MVDDYSQTLLALSFAFAFITGYSAFSLVQRVRLGGQARSWPWVIGSGISVGTGLWSEHYLHLIAADVSIANLSPSSIVLSYLIAVGICTLALRKIAGPRPTIWGLLPFCTPLGVALFAMSKLGTVTPTAASWLGLLDWHSIVGIGLSILVVWGAITAAFHLSLKEDWHSSSERAVISFFVAIGLFAIDSVMMSSSDLLANATGAMGDLSRETRVLGVAVVILCSITIANTISAVILDKRLQSQAQAARLTNAELEQRVAERTERLSQQEARMRAILTSALDCIITTDDNGIIIEFNPAAEQTFGCRRSDAIGKPVIELIVPAAYRDAAIEHIRGMVSRPAVAMSGERGEGILCRADGSKFAAEFSVSEISLGDETIYNLFLRDITTRKAAQAALKAAKESAEAASNAKTTFLATMSHEIRTPMNALLGLLELHSLSRLDEEQHDSVRLMRLSSKSLLRVIDDILDFSKIEAGKLEVGSEPTPLRDVLNEVCATFSAVAREKDLTLTALITDDLPAMAMTDPLRLRQILSNLVSNAIKFTEHGEVSVRSALRRGHDSTAMLEFEVLDTGIGMTPEVVQRCGEPFEQADAGMARRYGGSGLGLAITRRLCTLLGGQLEITSSLGTGTRIKVRLPFHAVSRDAAVFQPEITQGQRARSVPAPSVAEAAGAHQLILVVDDHPTNRTLFVRQLRWLGYACEAFSSGRTALARYQERLACGSPFAMVITDCQMPDMDGYELARHIRTLDIPSMLPVPLLAFTANTIGGISDLCRSSGFNDLLIKPANLATLKNKLDHWLPLPQERGVPLHSDLEPAVTQLAIEDPALQDEFRLAHEEDLAVLKQGETGSDAALVARAAHRIKGAASMLGAKQLEAAASTLGQVTRAGDWTRIHEAAQRLQRITDDLFEEFDRNPRRTRQAS
jgi:PAS domain S-box-containing protein